MRSGGRRTKKFFHFAIDRSLDTLITQEWPRVNWFDCVCERTFFLIARCFLLLHLLLLLLSFFLSLSCMRVQGRHGKIFILFPLCATCVKQTCFALTCAALQAKTAFALQTRVEATLAKFGVPPPAQLVAFIEANIVPQIKQASANASAATNAGVREALAPLRWFVMMMIIIIIWGRGEKEKDKPN